MNRGLGFGKWDQPRRAAASAVVAVGLLTLPAHSVTLQIRDVVTDEVQTNTGLTFGGLPSAKTHHTARQYLDIGHPDSPYRRVYLYTNNTKAYNKTEAGLVSDKARPPLPLFFKNFPSKPNVVDGTFSPASESTWTEMIEQGDPGFDSDKPLNALLTPTGGKSLVYLGVTVAPSTLRGDYQGKMVLEESSTVPDIVGPGIEHTPFNDVVLIDIPIGVGAVLYEEPPTVPVGTLHFRLAGDPVFQTASAGLTLDPKNPMRYIFDAALPAGIVAPGVLEYYFTALDEYQNESRLPPVEGDYYRANLVPEFGTVTRSMTSAGGRVDVAVGDPRRPGFSLSVPAGTTLQSISVSQKDPSLIPTFKSLDPVSAFEVGPSGTRFSRVATLTIPYLDEDDDGLVDGTGADEKLLRIYWFDGIEWRVVGGSVDVVNNLVSASISHFSVFGLFPAGGPVTAESVRPKEKIFTPNGDGVWDAAVFNINVGDGPIEIQIFNVRGERVRLITNVPEWDGRDDDGKVVENGTYVYRLTGQGLTVTGMIAVAR
ncbi:MAG: gliding motility-associated C-terminal domain-containing protein [Elusimicrobia bacterium]|nr:gliding motility-associated C-terminal domain-containing protein [Elusimicrobiota bacterium]